MKLRHFSLLLLVALIYHVTISTGHVTTGGGSDHVVNTKMQKKQTDQKKSTKFAEDNIPVIEIKGEGKPMTAAQIRALEEDAEGNPLDIKVKKTWTPRDCPVKAKRRDFVTFHYKGYMEDGKKFEQTYGRDAVTIQLGVGMTIPGLDKGLKGVCETELRKITIPWRLCRRKKSRVWKNIPKEEHWISFDVEVFHVEPWTPKLQFDYMDLNKDKYLTSSELVKFAEKLRKDYGKNSWPNPDIDHTHGAKYYVQYFDANLDQKIDPIEYESKMRADESEMNKKLAAANQKRAPSRGGGDGRKRDPGLAWILDFNNDGYVSRQEMDAAPDLLEQGPQAARDWLEEMRRNLTKIKTEL